MSIMCYNHDMNELIYDDIKLETLARDKFGVDVSIDSVILRGVPVSRSVRATVFLTDKKLLYVILTAQSSLTLGDVRKFVLKMGLKPEAYMPPKGMPGYFYDIAIRNFQTVFPGRTHVSKEDLLYYRTLAPYNPALVQISEVPTGEIKQFDPDSHGQWRVAERFSYRRIKTS